VGLINSISLISRRVISKLLASVLAFIERVESDGGIVESAKCINKAIKGTPNVDGGEFLFNHYSLRVVSLDGTTEASACTITELNELL
tara:strand:+ start:510 stop:773 length:264 start_codon:yes stop_codon:yes gene_type:complete